MSETLDVLNLVGLKLRDAREQEGRFPCGCPSQEGSKVAGIVVAIFESLEATVGRQEADTFLRAAHPRAAHTVRHEGPCPNGLELLHASMRKAGR